MTELLDQCDAGCEKHFHITGGKHLMDCALYKYQKACDNLDLMKFMILSGEKIPAEFLNFLDEWVI